MIAAVVLAAGRGTRMQSDKAKVLHCVGGRTMLSRVLQQAQDADAKDIILVAGHECGHVVVEACKWQSEAKVNGAQVKARLYFALQRQQLGTAHAVAQAVDTLNEISADRVLILSGDVPLLRPQTIRRLISETGPADACAILTVQPVDNRGLGRIVRHPQTGHVLRIVEERDCANDEERAIVEVNAGVYLFDRQLLCAALQRIDNNNSQQEYYLTDAVRLLAQQGHMVKAILHQGDAEEALGVNTVEQLARAELYLSKHNIQ